MGNLLIKLSAQALYEHLSIERLLKVTLAMQILVIQRS